MRRQEMKQWQLSLSVILAAIVLVAFVLWLVPDTRMVPGLVFKGLVFFVIWVLMLFVPGVVGFFTRLGIDEASDHSNEAEVTPWLHVPICIAVGFAVCVAWMFGIRFLVSLPTWVNTVYAVSGWIPGLMEVLPWGWAIEGFIIFIVGYVLGNEENRWMF